MFGVKQLPKPEQVPWGACRTGLGKSNGPVLPVSCLTLQYCSVAARPAAARWTCVMHTFWLALLPLLIFQSVDRVVITCSQRKGEITALNNAKGKPERVSVL